MSEQNPEISKGVDWIMVWLYVIPGGHRDHEHFCGNVPQ